MASNAIVLRHESTTLFWSHESQTQYLETVQTFREFSPISPDSDDWWSLHFHWFVVIIISMDMFHLKCDADQLWLLRKAVHLVFETNKQIIIDTIFFMCVISRIKLYILVPYKPHNDKEFSTVSVFRVIQLFHYIFFVLIVLLPKLSSLWFVNKILDETNQGSRYSLF